MPCTGALLEGQTLRQRNTEIDEALARLEAALANGTVQIAIGATGALAFRGWSNRGRVTDACAYRTLTAKGSGPLRMAIARAEALAGRKVNARAIAAGVHSHDGGKTWGKD